MSQELDLDVSLISRSGLAQVCIRLHVDGSEEEISGNHPEFFTRARSSDNDCSDDVDLREVSFSSRLRTSN